MAGLEAFLTAYGSSALLGTALAFAAGGFAKGVVGFALPLVALSGMASFLPVQAAVGILIVPTLVSNAFQMLRGGAPEAWASLRKFWRLNLTLVLTIGFAAQLVVALPDRALYAILGAAITAFGLVQVLGWRPSFQPRHKNAVEFGMGVFTGILGGLTGIWGPPIVLYLLAAGVQKTEMVRVQCQSFALGSLVLLGAHLHSGVLDAVTLPVSVWMVLPALGAMFLGYAVHDRLNQEVFRTLTLVVLILSGLNLLRRAFGA